MCFVGVGICHKHYLVLEDPIPALALFLALATGTPAFMWTLNTWYHITVVMADHCHVCGELRYRPSMVRCKLTERVYCSDECAKRDPTLRAAKKQAKAARRERERAAGEGA